MRPPPYRSPALAGEGTFTIRILGEGDALLEQQRTGVWLVTGWAPGEAER